jgi:hypothetical protein
MAVPGMGVAAATDIGISLRYSIHKQIANAAKPLKHTFRLFPPDREPAWDIGTFEFEP